MPDDSPPRTRILTTVTLALCVLWTGAGCSRSKTETPKETADARPASVTPATTTGVKPDLNPDKPAEKKEVPPPEGKGREDPKAALAEAIRNAEPLTAPDLIPGKGTNINEFSPTIRKLVGDEFAFKDAQRKVYRASFSQRSVESSPLIKLTDGRNAIVRPGTFDFDRKRATWALHLWYIHWDEKTIGDSVYPGTTDSCSLVASFDLDEKTARSWREAYDRGSLSLTVWFRPVKVLRADWKAHPRFNDGTQTHDIAIEVEVLRFEAQLDTPAPKASPDRPLRRSRPTRVTETPLTTESDELDGSGRERARRAIEIDGSLLPGLQRPAAWRRTRNHHRKLTNAIVPVCNTPRSCQKRPPLPIGRLAMVKRFVTRAGRLAMISA